MVQVKERTGNLIIGNMPNSHNIDIRIEDSKWRDSLLNWEEVCERAVNAVLKSERLLGLPIELTIILGNDALIQDLNKSFGNKDAPTNVLAFPTKNLHVSPILPNHIGDVFLAFETCKRELLENEGLTNFSDHIYHLIVHGVLHLLGHEHEEFVDAKQMESLEKKILANLGVKDPYE